MADLSAIMKQMQLTYAPVNQATVNGINQSYAGQSAADSSVYNNSLAQAKQTLSQVPSQYNAQRNSADITKNQAMNLLPTNLANSGAATDSGANYTASTNIGNTFQNTMGTIGQSQDAAKLTAQNSINTLNADESASQAKLDASKASDLANAYTTAASNLISNGYSQYNTTANREESAAEAAASLAEKQQEAANTLAYKKAVATTKTNTAKSKAAQTSYNQYLKQAQAIFNKSPVGTGNYSVDDFAPQKTMTYIQSLPLTNSQKEQLANQVSPRKDYNKTLTEYIKWYTTNQAKLNNDLYGK